MKVIYGIGKAKDIFKNAVLAIGVFDGVHIGHQKLIKAAVQKAKSLGGPAVVMTFSPHPVQVLRPDNYLPFIVSLPQRLRLIEQLGVAACVVVRFTRKFSQLTPQQFIKRYLIGHIRPREIFVGDDFCFGKNRGGTVEYLKEAGREYGFKVNAVAPVRGGRKKVGSSRVRQLIAEGKLYVAKRFLGRDVSVVGRVVKGEGRGRTLGFPTANIYPQNKVLPPVGVYAARVVVGGEKFNGMANVGRRPTFKGTEGEDVNIEVHIFQFQKMLYGKEITVEFIKRVRQERVFSSKEKLVAQLKRDKVRVEKIL
jgi:riboflavin kinase/FMN adenylyltransferase